MRILLVEDEPTIRRLYSKKLECDSWDHYREYEEYDLYILDVGIKDSDKTIYYVISDIQKRTDAPIIIFSNFGRETIEEKLRGLKVHSILLKINYPPKELKEYINETFT